MKAAPELPVAYHYTCDHNITQIRRTGILIPNRHLWLPKPLVWLTDLDVPIREALGLTSTILKCDRTKNRVECQPTTAVWWPHYARSLPAETRYMFEAAPGAAPVHWWVSDQPVPLPGYSINDKALTEAAYALWFSGGETH